MKELKKFMGVNEVIGIFAKRTHLSCLLVSLSPYLLFFFFLLSLFNSAQAQKYACVNTDYVLRSIPEYSNAQKRLDKYVEDWQKELSDKLAEVDDLKATFEQESYLLPDNLKKRRQEEIKSKEQEVRDLQQQRFGVGGDLDKKRAELLKPVQDRVFATIERVAQEKNYAFVFDKAGSPTVLFASKKYDISNEVLELMGFKPGATAEPEGAASSDKKKPSNPEMRDSDGMKVRSAKGPAGARELQQMKRERETNKR